MSKKVRALAVAFLETVEEFPEIVYIGEPVLKLKAVEVPTEEGKKIGERLGQILVRYRERTGIGRGLAAPQIDESVRVFVTYLGDEVQMYINPKITWRSDKVNYYRELCLSSGLVWADVERPESIKMKWTDERGDKQKKVFDGFLARLMQHEYDHLEGVINLDRAVRGSVSLAIDDPLREQLRDKPLV